MHLAEPLPAGTITSTVQEVPGLGEVLQPMPSFGGRPPETERGYHVVQVVPYGMEIPPVGQGSYVIWQYQASTKQSGYTPNR